MGDYKNMHVVSTKYWAKEELFEFCRKCFRPSIRLESFVLKSATLDKPKGGGSNFGNESHESYEVLGYSKKKEKDKHNGWKSRFLTS